MDRAKSPAQASSSSSKPKAPQLQLAPARPSDLSGPAKAPPPKASVAKAGAPAPKAAPARGESEARRDGSPASAKSPGRSEGSGAPKSPKSKAGGDGDRPKLSKTPPATLNIEGTSFGKLPKLKEVEDPEQRAEVLKQKLTECCQVHDFQKDTELAEKEGKRQTLAELAEFYSKGGLTLPMVTGAVAMIGANIFRDLPHVERVILDFVDPEEEEPLLDQAWPHLELVYEILIRILSLKDSDSTLIGKSIDATFLKKLLELLDTEDPRERSCLKSVVSKVWNRIATQRSFLRKSMQNVLLRAIYEDYIPNGIGEILEVLASRVINNFAVPMKQEHKDLLLKILLPLHKVKYLFRFNLQLSDCVRAFLNKDPKLHSTVLTAFLRYWPCSMSSKQILFIVELEDILSSISSSEFKLVQAKVAQQLAACVSCPNSDVAEKALALFKNERVVKLVSLHCREQFRTLISALYNNTTQHWHNNVHTKTLDALRAFLEADAELFDSSSAKHRKEADERTKKEELRAQRWAQLQELHDKKQANLLQKQTKLAANAEGRKTVLFGEEQGQASAALSSIANNDEGKSKTLLYAKQASFRRSMSARQMIFSMGSATVEWSDTLSSTMRPSIAWRAQRGQLPLPDRRCAVRAVWDPGSSSPELHLQALLLNVHGSIITAVHEHNLASNGLWHVRGGSVHSDRIMQGLAIWFDVSSISEEATMVLFVATLSKLGAGGSQRCFLHLVDAEDQEVKSEKTLTMRPSDMAIVARVRRDDDDRWDFAWTSEMCNSGAHFMDCLGMLGSFIGQAFPLDPSEPARLAFTDLRSGEVVDLPRPAAGRFIYIGLGWDLGAAAKDTVGFDVNVTLVLLKASAALVGAVPNEESSMPAVRHSGPGLLGSGVLLDLDSVAQEVVQIALFANFEKERVNLTQVTLPQCCLVDADGCAFARFTIQQEDGEKQTSGLLAARLLRHPEQGRWSFQAIGTHGRGSVWSESLDEMRPTLQKSLQELQVHAPQESLRLPHLAVRLVAL